MDTVNSGDRRCTAPPQFALLALFSGSLLVMQFAYLDMSLSSSDLPKHVLDELNAYAVFGNTLALNPGHVVELLISVGSLLLIFFMGFRDPQTYGIRLWTRRLRRHPHAQRLLSSLWMQVSGLADYYLLIHPGLRSKQRRLYWRGRQMRHDSRNSTLRRFTNPASPSDFGLPNSGRNRRF